MADNKITKSMDKQLFLLYCWRAQELINRILGCCRFVYNHFLAVRRDEWTANHKSVTYKQTSAMLTNLKRYEEYSWLKQADSMAMQESLKNLDTAYQNFFKHHTNYPKMDVSYMWFAP